MGLADLCTLFFLRASEICRPRGRIGAVATSTISEGDTKEVGLDQLRQSGWHVRRAVRATAWPGEASLVISKIWLSMSGGPGVLDDRPVIAITSDLRALGRVSGNPKRLAANAGKSFIGSFINGKGFVLSPEEAQRFFEEDARNRDVIYPYLSGDELNSSPADSPDRWVINFSSDWSEERASSYTGPYSVLERLVKPVRAKVNRKAHRERWWQYGDKRPALYERLDQSEFAVAIVIHSGLLRPAVVPKGVGGLLPCAGCVSCQRL